MRLALSRLFLYICIFCRKLLGQTFRLLQLYCLQCQTERLDARQVGLTETENHEEKFEE